MVYGLSEYFDQLLYILTSLGKALCVFWVGPRLHVVPKQHLGQVSGLKHVNMFFFISKPSSQGLLSLMFLVLRAVEINAHCMPQTCYHVLFFIFISSDK